jgi:hypothetical protein
MKAIDLSTTTPTLAEILDLAGEQNVVLRTPEGRQFVLAEIDDFAEEVEKASRNKALMELLDERSVEMATVSLSEVRERVKQKKLGMKKRGNGRKGNARAKQQ